MEARAENQLSDAVAGAPLPEDGFAGMPKPKGWPLERVVSGMAGGVVLGTLALGRFSNPRWRLMTSFVGANLVLNAAVGWCPSSLVLHRLGVRTAAESGVCARG